MGSLTRNIAGSPNNTVRTELYAQASGVLASTTPGIDTHNGQWIELMMPAMAGPFEVRGTIQGNQNYRLSAAAQIYQGTVPGDLTSRTSSGEVDVTLIVGAAGVFIRQPAPDSVSPCETATFTVETRGCSGASLRWRHNGIPLNDGASSAGAIIIGSTTPVLTINGPGATDSGLYDCVLTNECGSVASETAILGVCAADFFCDGQVDDNDFVAFATAYDILVCSDPSMPANCPSDLNDDGIVDDADFVAFAAAYDTLLCP